MNKPFRAIPHAFRCLRGERWYINGEVDFGTTLAQEKPDTFKRSVFGPAIMHNGVVLANNDYNQQLALRRLTCAREPLQIGYEESLQERQRAFFELVMPHLLPIMKTRYAMHFDQYQGMIAELYQHYADEHEKKHLRVQSFKDMQRSGLWGRRLWLRSVLYRLKREEYAKLGKYGRMIGDLGVAASLQGFRATAFLKLAQSEELIPFLGGHLQFVKTPTLEELTLVFDRLLHPLGRFYYVCFSDDACYSVVVQDRVHIFNVDISSCDASHGPAVFKALVDLMPIHLVDDVQILVDQCALPIRIVSCSDRTRKVLLKPSHPRLYSGSTITTAINNIASFAIAASLAIFGAHTPGQVRGAAQASGYVVTVEPCEIPEDIQFLKHSPVLVNGEYLPLLNLGVLLRLSGNCKGDLPGVGDWKERARSFQKALLRGVYPTVNIDIVSNMRRLVDSATTTPVMEEFARKHYHDKVLRSATWFSVSSAQLGRRYRLTEEDYIELIQFSKCEVGWSFASPAVGKILLKDYQMTINDSLASTYPTIPQTLAHELGQG